MLNNQTKKIIQVGLLVSLSLALVACGGGGGGGTPSSSTSGGGSNPKESQTTGSTGGVTVSNVYSQPKDLGVGDLLYVDFNKDSSLDFSGTQSNAEYTFIVANTSANAGNLSVQLNGDLSEAGLELAKDLGVEENEEESSEIEGSADLTADFHDLLRQQEEELENLEAPNESFSVSKASTVNPAVSLGETKTFKVLAGLNSSSGTVDVEAAAECVGSNVNFFVDTRVTQDMLSDADVASLCSRFDASIVKEQELFGTVSDVNQDGKVMIVFTPQVNRIGASGGGIITGFFNATDLYPSSSANASSNFMEILYIMVPDPQGLFGVQISRDFALANLLPSVLVHELQHAISYNQHVFIKGGTAEQPWLNEGLSHFAEDIFGQGQENASRYSIFLRNPNSYPLVTSSSPGLASRGAAYLFVRFLYEQSGQSSGFIQRLLQTSKVGTANVESAFAGTDSSFDQFGEFFLRWSIALAMTDKGLTQDPRYTYQKRFLNSETGHYQGVCLSCSAGDGRGTVLSGISSKTYGGYQDATTAQSSSRFYSLTNLKDKLSFSNSSSRAEGFGVLIRKK